MKSEEFIVTCLVGTGGNVSLYYTFVLLWQHSLLYTISTGEYEHDYEIKLAFFDSDCVVYLFTFYFKVFLSL